MNFYVLSKNENLFCQYIKRLDNDLVKRDEIPNIVWLRALTVKPNLKTLINSKYDKSCVAI